MIEQHVVATLNGMRVDVSAASVGCGQVEYDFLATTGPSSEVGIAEVSNNQLTLPGNAVQMLALSAAQVISDPYPAAGSYE